MGGGLPAIVVYGPWVWKFLLALGALAGVLVLLRLRRRALDRVAAPHLARWAPPRATLDDAQLGRRVTLRGTLCATPPVERPEDGRPGAAWTVTEPSPTGVWISERPAQLTLVSAAGEIPIEGEVRVVRGSREALTELTDPLKRAARRAGSPDSVRQLEARRVVVLTASEGALVQVEGKLARRFEGAQGDYRSATGRWALSGDAETPAKLAVQGRWISSFPPLSHLALAALAGIVVTFGGLSGLGRVASANLQATARRAVERTGSRRPYSDTERWALYAPALLPGFTFGDVRALSWLWPELGPPSRTRADESIALAQQIDLYGEGTAQMQLRFGRLEDVVRRNEDAYVSARAAYALGRYELASERMSDRDGRTPEEVHYFAGLHTLAGHRSRAEVGPHSDTACLRTALRGEDRFPSPSPFEDRLECQLLAAAGLQGAPRRRELMRALHHLSPAQYEAVAARLSWHPDFPEEPVPLDFLPDDDDMFSAEAPRASLAVEASLAATLSLLFVESLLDAPGSGTEGAPRHLLRAALVEVRPDALGGRCPLPEFGNPGLESRVLARLLESSELPRSLQATRAHLDMSRAVVDAWLDPSASLLRLQRARGDLVHLRESIVGEDMFLVLSWLDDVDALIVHVEQLEGGGAVDAAGPLLDVAPVLAGLWAQRAPPTVEMLSRWDRRDHDGLDAWISHGDARICTDCSRREAFCQAALRARASAFAGQDRDAERWRDAAFAHHAALIQPRDAVLMTILESRYAP